jgi:predicted nucleic-acid-binding protein
LIGIDTSILVRYLTQDDPVQSPRATAVLERQLSRHMPGFVSVVTVAETAWVSARCYGVA